MIWRAWRLTQIATACYERLALALSAQGGIAIPGTEPTPTPENSSASRPTRTEKAYRAFSMSAVGLEMGVAVFIGWGIGYLVDDRFDTAPWGTLVFLGVGVAAGFKALFRAARQAKALSSESNE